MALSLLHQTVNPVGPLFVPNLQLFGWFTLYWDCSADDLVIDVPTNGVDGQEFIVDLIRVGIPVSRPHFVAWTGGPSPYWSGMVRDQHPTAQIGPWTGEQAGLVRAVRHRFRVLHDCVALESYNAIAAY